MYKGYKYTLILRPHQKEFMLKSFGCSRVVYNHCLTKKIETYKNKEKIPSSIDLCKEIVQLKKTEEFKWLKEVDHQSLSSSIRNLETAFSSFYKKKTKFPKYKSRKDNTQSCQFTQGVKINLDKNLIKFPKIGWCKVKISRKFEGKLKTVTVSKTPSDKFFVSILVDTGELTPTKPIIDYNKTVGIDLGIKTFATFSNGEKVENPKYLENFQKRLLVLQRRHSRKQKGSKNKNKSRIKLAKLYEKITNKRNDFLHKLSTKIISENQTIVLENLNVCGMIKNHKLARSISSASWSTFNSYLEYKAEWYGKNIIRIGRFEPSSKMCSCGHKNDLLTLKDREWTCHKCNVTHDRDILAANNIKKFGLRNSGLVRPGELEELSTLVETMKQES